MRLDLYLYEKGLAESRTLAQRLIKEGAVTLCGRVCRKPSQEVEEGSDVSVDTSGCRYVGRGGYKLEAALSQFSVNVCDRICLDVGASSGGFTDCLLQRGAARVYAVENGSGQLHVRLREDPRVISRENTNARYLTRDSFDEEITLAVMDVSFISQTLILPALADVVASGDIITLIKPQFEVGRAHLGGGGIVRDPKARKSAIDKVVACAEGLGLTVCATIESPILGGDGNTEYLIHLKK